MNHDTPDRCATGRRAFLKAAAALPVGLAAAQAADSAGAASPAAAMPTVPFGTHRISRLVAGSNTVNGGSHLSRFVDREMRVYFTEERIQEYLGRLSHAGVNLWQASGRCFQHWLRFRRSGGSMQFISLAHAGSTKLFTVKEAADRGFLGLAHHGEVTDRLFKSGRIDEAREFLKEVRDAGLMVGLSTHMPAVIEYVEEKDWDVDFYMTCVYERHRSREELKKLLGRVPIRVGEVYLEEDPPRMYRVIQATRKPCLAFKILAAGRLCQSPGQVSRAFEETFRHIKPTDAVIVGIWPKWTDQIREDAELVKRYGGTAAT
jgi:hypothetical protein